nr:transposase [Nocardiopsis valliformis]
MGGDGSLRAVPGFTDALASYDVYDTAQQLFCAHLLRELQALVDFEPDYAAWAQNMADMLLRAREKVEQASSEGRSVLEEEELARIGTAYRRVVAYAKAGPRHALAERFNRRRDDYLRFAIDFAVPFTSNAAERDVRMVKLQMKVSGGWRTLSGAEYFCRIRSFISAVRKQGQAVLAKLPELFAGNAWLLVAI